MFTKGSHRALMGALLGGLIALGTIGPAAAHTRTITEVHGLTWEDGTINTQAWLDPEQHAGTMKITLKKKNAAGDWVFVDRKTAHYQIGWGYTVNFDPVAGDKRCKPIAKFTSNNHPDLKKAGPAFDC